MHPHTRRPQLGGGLVGELVELVGHGDDPELLRRQPSGEVAADVLEEHPVEALDRTENGTVEHHRAMPLVVGADVVELEALGEVEVGLDGAELPRAPEGILEVELDLRAVEGALPFRDGVGEPLLFHAGDERLLRLVPARVLTEPIVGAGGDHDADVVEVEVAIDLEDQLQEGDDLALGLLLGAEDVRVVLGEGAHPGEPLGHAAPLIAMEATEVGHAHRQIAVAPQGGAEEQAVARAVHRLDAEADVLVDDVLARPGVARPRLGLLGQLLRRVLEPVEGRREEHVLTVAGQVTAGLEERPVEDLRGDDLLVTVPPVELANVVDEPVVDRGAAPGEEGRGRSPRVEGEELQLLAELAVVPLLRLFDLLQVPLEQLGVREGGPVDALEHRVPLVTPPVRAGHVGQLEGLEETGARDVGPLAEVDPLAVPIDRELTLETIEVLRLVGLTHAVQQGLEVLAAHHLAPEGHVLGDDLLHLRFDGGEVLLVEGPARPIVVVVEAVLGSGTEGDLGAGEEALHRLRHHVGGRVPDDRQRVVLVGADRLDRLRVRGHRLVQVLDLTVHSGGDDLLVQLPLGFEEITEILSGAHCCSYIGLGPSMARSRCVERSARIPRSNGVVGGRRRTAARRNEAGRLIESSRRQSCGSSSGAWFEN